MIALQESSEYRKENRLWLLLASKKNKLKKAANNVSVRGAFSPFLFLFVSCHFPSEAQDSSVSVLNYLYFYFGPIPYFETRYDNTTLYPSFTLTNLFLVQKCLVFENLVEYDHL